MSGSTPWNFDGEGYTQPSNSVSCSPGTSIQSTFNANPGKDVWLRAGTHGPQSVTIPAGRRIVGERSVSGARLATVDGANSSIRFVTGSTSGVTVKGIIVTRFFRNNVWGTAIDFRGQDSSVPAPNSKLIDCEVSYSGQGVGIVSGCQVLDSYIHHCDVYGLSGNGDNMLIAGCDMGYNRQGSFDTGNSGNMKIVFSTNTTMRNCYVHHSTHVGIWFDLGNGRVGGTTAGAVARNYIHDNLCVANASNGIFIEWGFEHDVYNNEVYDNGINTGIHWPGAAGINTTAASYNNIYGNKLDNNGHGIILRMRPDTDGFPGNNGQNDHHAVYGNTVRQPAQTNNGVMFPGPVAFPYTIAVGIEEGDGGFHQIPGTNTANTYYTASNTWYLGTLRSPGAWGPSLQYDPTGWNALGSALSRTAPDTILTAGSAPPEPPPAPETITVYPYRVNAGGAEVI